MQFVKRRSQFSLRHKLDKKFESFFVGRRNDRIRPLDSFSIVVDAERRVLSRFEAERPARIDAEQPEIFAQIFSLDNLGQIMFFANCNALLFRHQSSFAKKVTQRIYTKKETGGTPETLVSIFAESFVGEGDDGIVTRGAQSRIDCARRRAKNGEENRAKNPLIGDGDLQRGDGLREDGLRQKRERDAEGTSDDGESQRFAQQELCDTGARKSEC